MSNRLYLSIFIASILAAGCAHESGKPAATITPSAPLKPALMVPFRYHKLIEVSPGDDFDVLSWGRGSIEVGSFEILHSDSVNMKYTTTTGDLDGSIVDAFNTDMDMDGNPEILIQAKTNDTVYNTTIYAFEFSNGKANKLNFPKLTSSQKKGYRGNDNFYIQDGNLMRQFAIYDGSGKAAKPTGQKRLFQYGLHDNEFTIKQIGKDSTETKQTTVVPALIKTQAEKKHNSSQKEKHTSSKKKKHKEEEHKSTSHKKKKRHHHNN
jgi:CRISPR/Cas system-associated protein endoribonuclease Cas2